MIKIVPICLGLIITSFFYFPFFVTFLPSVNTKMMVALAGLILLMFNLSRGREAKIDKNFFIISLLALGVSFVSLMSMTLNNTTDNSYLSYIISMWVWCGAGYFVVGFIKCVHGKCSIELLCQYMIVVGVCQCLVAIAIDNIPFVEQFVHSFLAGNDFMGKAKGRTHGIGCGLDVGGARLGVLLVMIAYLLPRMQKYKNYKIRTFLLLISYGIIIVIGNMIGRTATTGAIISLLYLVYVFYSKNEIIPNEKRQFLTYSVILFLCMTIIISVFLYNGSIYWAEKFRFGFEGFFSLVEVGSWEVQSNDMLMEGMIFPDNTWTWIIGDGYMADPYYDPYYIGEASYGFYKNTDAGYSRFIFYFGLVGLAIFSLFFIKVACVCISKFRTHKMLFLMILALCFIVWIKATSDLFPALAAFLCISKEDNDEYEKNIELYYIGAK